MQMTLILWIDKWRYIVYWSFKTTALEKKWLDNPIIMPYPSTLLSFTLIFPGIKQLDLLLKSRKYRCMFGLIFTNVLTFDRTSYRTYPCNYLYSLKWDFFAFSSNHFQIKWPYNKWLHIKRSHIGRKVRGRWLVYWTWLVVCICSRISSHSRPVKTRNVLKSPTVIST